MVIALFGLGCVTGFVEPFHIYCLGLLKKLPQLNNGDF